MPTTSSPLASDVLVNSLIKMEQQSSIAGAGDPILHFPPALQISPAGAMQALSAQPSSSSSVAASVPHLLLSQQQPVLPPPSLPTVEAVAGAVAAAAAASGTGDEDCKVKLEIDDLFPSVPSWDETGPTVSASAIASTAAPPAFLTVTMPSLSTTNAATSTVVKTVRIPSLQHSISVPAGDVEAALKLPQVPTSSSASALNLNALRPQPPQHPVPSAALASAGLRIAIPQSADTTTSAVGGPGLAPPTTPSPAGSSSIASPPAVAAIATAATASSTTKKTVFTAKGKKSHPGRSYIDPKTS